MCALVEELSNSYGSFLSLSIFPDLFSKVSLINSKFFCLDFLTIVSKQYKQKIKLNLLKCRKIAMVIIIYNGNSITITLCKLNFLVKDLKQKNKQLAPLHGKPYFLFPNILRRWSFWKNCAGMWSFLYYQEEWYLFFPKISFYSLNEKWKMIFLKIWYFFQMFWKEGLSKKKIALEYHLSCCINWKNDISFSRKYDLIL